MTNESPLGGGSDEPRPSTDQPTTRPSYPAAGAATPPPPRPGRPIGLALAALIVGVVAFLLGLVPVVGTIVGLAAVVLGVIALLRRQSKVLSWIGLALGAVATVVSIVVAIGLGAAIDSVQQDDPAVTATSEPAPVRTSSTPAPTSTAPPPSAADDVPADYADALDDAETIAISLGSSKLETYTKLVAGGASEAAAQYAVDTVDADWQANAVRKAKAYVRDGMTGEVLRDQLVSEYGEQFTAEEADYALAHLDD